MEEQATTNVAVFVDEFHTGAHFRLAGGEVARTQLLAFRPPFLGKIAIEIEASFRSRDRQIEAVVAFHAALRHDTEIFAAYLNWIATHHQPRFGCVLLPRPIHVRDAHHQNATIAVNVFGFQALDGILVVGVRACGRPDVLRLVRHRPLRAVRVHARDHVQRAGVEQARDVVAFAVIREHGVDQFQRGNRTGKFGGVDVGVDVIRWLGQRLAGGVIGERNAPNRATLKALTNRGHARKVRVRIHGFAQQRGQFFKLDESVVGKHRRQRQKT